MTDASRLHLGKKPGRVEDDRHFHLTRDGLAMLEAPPASWEIAVKLEEVDGWPMLGNHRYGCCTRTAQGHIVLADEWNSGQRNTQTVRINEQMILDAYRHTGWRPEDPSTDQGDYLVDALKDWRANGLGTEGDGTPHRIYAYARVDLPSTYAASIEFRSASRLFGGAYLGLALPWSAAEELDAGKRWDAIDDEPYSWGGHAVMLKGWDEHGCTVVTWGEEQRASWRWMRRYCDEVWVVISEDLFNRRGLTQQGLNLDRLREKIASL